MKKLILFTLVMIGTLVLSSSAFAATSGFADKSIMFGKPVTYANASSNTFTDGSDSTYANIWGVGNLYNVRGDISPNSYVDRAYVRGFWSNGWNDGSTKSVDISVSLTYTDSTVETRTVTVDSKAGFKDLYYDFTGVTTGKVTRSYRIYADRNDMFKAAEFDLRRASYSPAKAADFVISSLSVTGDYQSAVLSWSKISPDYFLQYNIYQNNKLIKTIAVKGTQTYTVTGLSQLTDYSFAVSATDTYGQEYGKASAAYRTIQRPPPPTPSLSGTADDKTVSLKFFSNSTNIKKYVIYQDGQQLAEVQGNEYTITGLTNNKTYTYKVSAIDDNASSSELSDALTLTPKVRAIAKPSLVVKSGDAVVELSFSSDSKYVTTYTIYQDGKKVASTANQSYTVTGLKNGTAYTFYVVAVDDRGTLSDPSATVNGTPTQRILPDTNSGQQAKDDYLLVTWTATPDAVSYLIYLNGNQVAKVGSDLREFKITKALGYNPNAVNNRTEVRAVYADGAVGGGSNKDVPKTTLDEKGIGIGGSTVWQESMKIVFALSGFLLLGILIRFAPRIIYMAQQAVLRWRG